MEETNSGYRAIRIGDPSDWRLVMVIGAGGIETYLRNVENPMDEVEILFREEWDGDTSTLLERVESAVYDHPQLLDDFAADIAIETPKALWIPEKIVEKGEESDSDDETPTVEKIYNAVYEAAEEDIMQDYVDGKVCAYTLVPGLQAFLQRTFPGARIRCHQSVLVKRLCDRVVDMPRVYIDIRKGWADFVVFDGTKLLMAVSHEWRAQVDIRYHMFNLLDVYDIDPKGVHVSLSGMRDEKNALMQALRGDVAYVMKTLVPGIASKTGMSLVASLLTSRRVQLRTLRARICSTCWRTAAR